MNKEICWNITARCNQNCKYCHRFLNVNDLNYEDNMKILRKLKTSGVECITWTGGEALLLDGIDELLRNSHEMGIKNKLITNGKLLTKNRIDKLNSYLDSLTLSIDSIDSQINEELGRGKYHYTEVKEILDYIKEKGYNINLRINSVVCKKNNKNFVELCNFLNEYDIFNWRIFKFMPLREKAITNKENFEISLDDFSTTVKQIEKNSKINNIDTRIEKDMENKYILILANGDIVITQNGQDVKIGNALKDDFKI